MIPANIGKQNKKCIKTDCNHIKNIYQRVYLRVTDFYMRIKKKYFTNPFLMCYWIRIFYLNCLHFHHAEYSHISVVDILWKHTALTSLHPCEIVGTFKILSFFSAFNSIAVLSKHYHINYLIKTFLYRFISVISLYFLKYIN